MAIPGATSATRQDDPWRWCIAIALAFFVFLLHRLTIPSTLYFDEIHYVKAARLLLEMIPANREHPMFAKEVIAASITLLEDRPLAWRLPSAVFGAFGLFALGRLVWAASRDRTATILAILLLATNFMWFIQSRIAMLDIYAASLALIGLWQFAASLESDRPRPRLMAAGVALGLAIGSKWSPLPVVMLPGLTIFYLRLKKHPLTKVWQGIGLVEAALWLGVLPLAVYWLTYTPAFFYDAHSHRVSPFGFIAQHREMIALQDSVTKHHTYQSIWSQWVLNLRPIWFLYEEIDGAQRGILLLGNPVSMLVGLPALGWALWAGIARHRTDALAMAALYCASLGLWPLSGKPVQFYYHYLLPGAFLMACLALALANLWTHSGSRPMRLACGMVFIAILAAFAWFYPILSAAELHRGKAAFETWMWLDSWR